MMALPFPRAWVTFYVSTSDYLIRGGDPSASGMRGGSHPRFFSTGESP